MTAPEPIEWRPEQRALVLKAVIAEAEKALADLTEKMQPAFPLPATVKFESPLGDGAKLGHINRPDRRPDWVVTSREQLTEYFTREFPNVLETVFLVEVPGVAEPVALPEDHPLTVALAQVAPELLTPVERVPQQVIDDAVQQSRDDGEPAAPGIQFVRPKPGALSVVYDKREALPAIARLVRSGCLDWATLAPGSVLALPSADVEGAA